MSGKKSKIEWVVLFAGLLLTACNITFFAVKMGDRAAQEARDIADFSYNYVSFRLGAEDRGIPIWKSPHEYLGQRIYRNMVWNRVATEESVARTFNDGFEAYGVYFKEKFPDLVAGELDVTSRIEELTVLNISGVGSGIADDVVLIVTEYKMPPFGGTGDSEHTASGILPLDDQNLPTGVERRYELGAILPGQSVSVPLFLGGRLFDILEPRIFGEAVTPLRIEFKDRHSGKTLSISVREQLKNPLSIGRYMYHKG